jgi:hypothetical protein
MQKRLIGKYFTFKFSGRKSDISGVVLAYNENYTLIRTIVDYTADGYTIFKNEKVEHCFGDHEKVATKILKLKNYSSDEEPNIPIDKLANIFSFLSDNYKLIQLDTKKGDAYDVVRYLGQGGKFYLFDELTTTGKWRYKLRLPEQECRFISFDNNYLNALKLITKF